MRQVPVFGGAPGADCPQPEATSVLLTCQRVGLKLIPMLAGVNVAVRLCELLRLTVAAMKRGLPVRRHDLDARALAAGPRSGHAQLIADLPVAALDQQAKRALVAGQAAGRERMREVDRPRDLLTVLREGGPVHLQRRRRGL